MSSYVERRGVPWNWWAAAACVVGSVGWLFLAAPSAWVPLGAVGVSAVLLGAMLVHASSVSTAVDDDWLVVGEARLPRTRIEQIDVVRGASWQEAIRTLGGPHTWLSSRGHHPGGVVLTLADAPDPVRRWMVSSRDPERLAGALGHTGPQQTSSEESRNQHGS